tara:strand:- start:1921 stop:2256 length:336 start_codon:yes stop_codon:yes gene_type:complete
MISVRIERHGAQFCDDVLDDCQHADFFFSNGYLATCYHNEECMITEYYQKPMDVKLFETGSETELWELADSNKMSYNEWPEKQVIDEEMITDVLDYYAQDELVTVKEDFYE